MNLPDLRAVVPKLETAAALKTVSSATGSYRSTRMLAETPATVPRVFLGQPLPKICTPKNFVPRVTAPLALPCYASCYCDTVDLAMAFERKFPRQRRVQLISDRRHTSQPEPDWYHHKENQYSILKLKAKEIIRVSFKKR